ncbi:MAG: TIR domain-containing protein, partial [Gammaproteobacteria bacterium]|nr:TIR domain-containing protein [Gammaproteobacteria bacterium]
MADRPIPAYEGDEPFVFICYSHQDEAVVYEDIRWLQSQGGLIWYDAGISTGIRWTDETAQHVLNAHTVLFFASRNSAASENCLDEINFALDNDTPVIAVHIEEVELPPGAALRLAHRQAIHRYELDESEYNSKLARALGLTQGPVPVGVRSEGARQKKVLVAAGLIAVLLFVVGGIYFLRDESLAENPIVEVTVAGPLHNSIAVLPFENLSPDPDNAFFAAGIHYEIVNHLAKIAELSVIARTSVMRYQGVHKPISEIAAELNVETVMKGSVRYAADRVRITTQLNDAASGANLWSETYDREFIDLFAIETDIATRVAQALQAQFSPTESSKVQAVPTTNAIAHAHYLRANTLLLPTNPIGPVFDELDRAIQADPEFAAAYATKAFLEALPLVTFPDRTA